jgi:hypothetical protein
MGVGVGVGLGFVDVGLEDVSFLDEVLGLGFGVRERVGGFGQV